MKLRDVFPTTAIRHALAEARQEMLNHRFLRGCKRTFVTRETLKVFA